MKKIGILHITDLHYMDAGIEESIGDIKDTSMSSEFRKGITYSNSWDLFLSRGRQLLRNCKVDIIACTGDLGVGNDSKSIEMGANYIGILADRFNIQHDKVIVTPGNHDLNRKCNDGKEFEDFIKACQAQSFVFANVKDPALLLFDGIPVLALNTCLGGTEHAVYGFPAKFWDTIKSSLSSMEELQQDEEIRKSKDLTLKLQALDIPAIGRAQFENAFSKIDDMTGNLLILLTHHNPLPTLNLEIRPYASLVDSGDLIFSFMQNDRRVIILHGHTHCDSMLTAFSPEDLSGTGRGFVSSIGGSGLHGHGEAAVTHIEIIADDSNNFLTATLSRFVKRGSTFVQDKTTRIYDSPSEYINKLDLNKLKTNESMPFKLVAKVLKKRPNEKLAEELLRGTAQRQLSIDGVGDSIDDWVITKRG